MARRRADRSVNAELALGRGATGRYDGVSSATLPVVEGDAALAETGLAELPLIVPGGVSEMAFTTGS
jgi:hypothetical protein